MLIKFSQLIDKLHYPAMHRAVLSTAHAAVITFASEHVENRFNNRRKLVNVLNTISYKVISGEGLKNSWSESDPLTIDIVDEDLCKETIGDLYLKEKEIDWDILKDYVDSNTSSDAVTVNDVVPDIPPEVSQKVIDHIISSTSPTIINPTNKSDLYLKPPTIPQFDPDKIWRSGVVGVDKFVIYKSLPEIPTKQNEISVTTDVTKLTYNNLMNLYPNRFIPTRAECMYDKVDGLDYIDGIGVIIPIEGFTRDQLVENIIKYPHLFRLSKLVEGEIVSFYTTIEINGELHKTLDIWDTLPESKYIPRNSDFIKEYVARRYLLERDVKKIQHRYHMYGTLKPFLTLFTTPEEYIRLGYTDTLDIAKQCVEARVSYKQSRNPVLRRLDNA